MGICPRAGNGCPAYDGAGNDLGLSSVILNHFDYGNVFVGQYDGGDIQYRRHVNIDNLNSIYWKETKTFQDGCSAHISDSYYADGSADLPDAMGAFIIENTTFENYGLRANHHCDVGVTGYLCMPQYILHDVTWVDPRGTWMDFDINNGNTNDGGIFTLSPENIADKANGATFNVFPPAYNSVVAGNFEYLLDLPEAGCDRALKVFTRSLGAGQLVVEVFARDAGGNKGAFLAKQVVPMVNITDDKQGFALPVVPVEDYLYEVSLDTNNDGNGDSDIDPSWVIDFGDLTVSNRWGEEFLHLDVRGRNCDDEGVNTISSLHDRRFYAGGDFPDEMWGRGACSPAGNKHAKTPAVTCNTVPDLTQAWSDYPYSSWVAEFDARCGDCGENGACAGRYLGGGSPVLEAYECVCKPGWGGAGCDTPVSE